MYAESRYVDDPADCLFYHVIDLPGFGVMPGGWDLRPTIDAYLGGVDFSGRRVLDVGTAGGYLSFEAERRGAAEVVSFEMANADAWELVPFADPRFDLPRTRETFQENMRKLRNAYWMAHRLLGSCAKLVEGDLYNLPADLGTFDVVILGMILPHLRDPFRALASVAPHAADTLVITQQALQIDGPYAYFMPDPERLQPEAAWWSMSAACVARILDVLGFELERIERAEHICPDARVDGLEVAREQCSTFVAHRRDVSA